ncbi:MAG: glycosyl hydrolase family 28-related protein [Candidatus Accumulibacter sp. UW25]|jgi:hypothetical protein
MPVKFSGTYGIDKTKFQQDGVGAIIRNGLDKQKETVSVTDFGAVGDGVTDDTTAIQATFDAATEGSTILFPVGSYVITSSITSDKELTIKAYGATFLVNANVHAFIFTAPIIETSTLSANYVIGSKTLSVTGLVTALKKGQPFKVISNAVDPANRDNGSSSSQYRVSEWAVAGPNCTTTQINLFQSLRFSKGIDYVSIDGEEEYVECFTTAYNARVIVPSLKRFFWYGGTVKFQDGNDASWVGRSLAVVGYHTPIIKDFSVTRGYAQGIAIGGNYKPVVENCVIENLNDNTSLRQYGYGVSDASYMSTVSNCKFTNCRHFYTTGGLTTLIDNGTVMINWLSTGQIVGGVVSNCSGTGHGTFDTHHGARDVTFNNCVADGSDSWSYTSRGVNIVFNNCRALNSKYGFFVYTEYESGDNEDDLWVSGKPYGCTTAKIINPYVDVESRPFYISQCRKMELIGGTVKSTNQMLIENNGSDLVVDGTMVFDVTDHDGTRVLTQLNDRGIFNIYPLNSNLAPNADWVARTIFSQGSEIRVNAKNAINSGSTMSVFRSTNINTFIVNNGRMYLTLSPDFTKFVEALGSSIITANPRAYSDIYRASEVSEIRFEVDGHADNTELSFAELVKTKLKVTTVDETGFFDGTGSKKRARKLSSYTVDNLAIAGTGVAISPAFSPNFIVGEQLNEAGHCVYYRLRVSKTGSSGAASIIVRAQTSYVETIPINATDRYGTIEIWVNTIGVGSQVIIISSSWSPSASVINPATMFHSAKAESSSFTSYVSFLRFDVNAAVGDTITFHETEIFSDIVGYGLA